MKFKSLIILGLMAASLISSPSYALEHVTVRLKWLNQAQFAGYYVAKEKGYYKDAGLDVSIEPGGPNFPAIQMVAGGAEQFGVTGADQILLGRAKGVPVVALAAIYRRDPFVLFSLKKSGITTVEQFKGKTIGVQLGGNEELIYRAMLKKAGLTAADVTEMPAKFDISPVLDGQASAWPGYVINEVLAAKEKGFDVNVISPSSYGISLYADTLFTTEQMLKDKPKVVAAFVSATLKGWKEAIANPEEAANITLKYGDKLTYSHEFAMMKASIPFLEPDAKPLGYMDAAGWNSMQSLLLNGGFLTAPVDLKAAYTTTMMPAQ